MAGETARRSIKSGGGKQAPRAHAELEPCCRVSSGGQMSSRIVQSGHAQVKLNALN